MYIVCFAHIFGVAAEVHLHMRILVVPLDDWLQRYKDTWLQRYLYLSNRRFPLPIRGFSHEYEEMEIPLGSPDAGWDGHLNI